MIRDLEAILGAEHRGALRTYLATVVAHAVCQGLAMVLLVPALERLFAGDTAGAVRWTAALAVAAVATCVLHYVAAMRGFAVAVTVLRTLQARVGDHVVALPLGWFSAERTGRLSKMVTGGTVSLAGMFAHLLAPLIVGVVTPATIGLAMFVFDWRLALCALVGAPLLFVIFRWSAGRIGRSDELTDAAAVAAGDRVVEFARTQRVLRAFGRGAEGHRPLETAVENQRAAGRRAVWSFVPGTIAGGFGVQLVFSALIVVGVLLALGGDLDPVRLVAVLALAALFAGPLSEVVELSGATRMARNDIRRIADVLAESPLPEPDVSSPTTEPGAVEFAHVTFGYDPAVPVLRDVSFRVPPRTMTALVGASGSGKSTIARLTSRFFDVDGGVVRVGGVDVRDRSTDDLMAQLAPVFQDVYLFDDTLEANIRVGRPDASDAEVRDAAALAGVTEIVDRLPDGWASRVGEGGTSLSGGERQRVSIARAVLKAAPVVLLDEATAALDPENERVLSEAVPALMERSTLLVIAHRLSTVVAADQIVVLGDGDDAGRVVERGTHDELLAAGGRYAAFWHERSRSTGWRLSTGAAQ
ncbi:ABC transporter ATP-binding protein [Pseudonocardia endophytica]|uniref:ATP-binding cassette subfamily B protein n=1 Tax=Pseudonocardia endophytica TaxID=401976 RepID=A0A4R1HP83_PSEEN|nr:ABC transporter ATP-binding protein [Pseudonocardia endophytica]TCK21539.1 ATP-binding cassette subfamily B protein [Pseudonocardia endophytica]